MIYEMDYRGDQKHYDQFSEMQKRYDRHEIDEDLEILCWEYLDTLS